MSRPIKFCLRGVSIKDVFEFCEIDTQGKVDKTLNTNSDEVLKLIRAGVTLEAISNMIIKMYYIEGIITFDVAEIIKPVFLLHMLADARDAGVKNIKIFR